MGGNENEADSVGDNKSYSCTPRTSERIITPLAVKIQHVGGERGWSEMGNHHHHHHWQLI